MIDPGAAHAGVSVWLMDGRTRRWLLWLALPLALVSLGIGVANALGSSLDFQWSPTRMLWKGINPYAYYLGPDRHEIILAQAPNYGHLLYLLLWPIALLDWPAAKLAWAFTNLLFLGLGLWMLGARLQDKTDRQLFLAAALLLCIGFSARNVIANGQQTLLVFVATVVFLLNDRRPVVSGLALAVLFTKYSFGLPIVLLALVLGRYRAVLVAAGVTAVAVLAFGLLSGASGLALLLGPITVGRAHTAIGLGDLLSLGRRLGGGDALANAPIVALAAALNLGYFAVMRYRLGAAPGHDLRRDALLLAGTIYLSMGTIYHLKYDYQMLILCLFAFILSRALRPRAMLGLMAAHFLVFWMLPRHDALFNAAPLGNVAVSLMIAAFIGLAVYSMRVAFAMPKPLGELTSTSGGPN